MYLCRALLRMLESLLMKLIARTWGKSRLWDSMQTTGQAWLSSAPIIKEQREGLARRLQRQTLNAEHASLVLDYNYTKKL